MITGAGLGAYRQCCIEDFSSLAFGDILKDSYVQGLAGEANFGVQMVQNRPRKVGVLAIGVDIQTVISAHAGKTRWGKGGTEQPLYLVQAHAISIELDESIPSAHNVVKTLLIPGCKVTSAQDAAPLVPLAQVLRAVAVAHRHIFPAVDELAGLIRT